MPSLLIGYVRTVSYELGAFVTVFTGSPSDSILCLLSISFLNTNTPSQERMDKTGQTQHTLNCSEVNHTLSPCWDPNYGNTSLLLCHHPPLLWLLVSAAGCQGDLTFNNNLSGVLLRHKRDFGISAVVTAIAFGLTAAAAPATAVTSLKNSVQTTPP